MNGAYLDIKKMIEESQGSLTAAGTRNGPEVAGEIFMHGPTTSDPAGLVQIISAVGVPSVELPKQSFDKIPSPPGV